MGEEWIATRALASRWNLDQDARNGGRLPITDDVKGTKLSRENERQVLEVKRGSRESQKRMEDTETRRVESKLSFKTPTGLEDAGVRLRLSSPLGRLSRIESSGSTLPGRARCRFGERIRGQL